MTTREEYLERFKGVLRTFFDAVDNNYQVEVARKAHGDTDAKRSTQELWERKQKEDPDWSLVANDVRLFIDLEGTGRFNTQQSTYICALKDADVTRWEDIHRRQDGDMRGYADIQGDFVRDAEKNRGNGIPTPKRKGDEVAYMVAGLQAFLGNDRKGEYTATGESMAFDPNGFLPITKDNLDDEATRPLIEALYDRFMKVWKVYIMQNDDGIATVDRTLKALESSGNLILHGAPGTGKTYLARQVAAKMLGIDPEQLSEEGYRERFGFVQFHPSYDYTDFVEGLRPVKVTAENGSQQIGFELRPGTFMSFVAKARKAMGTGDDGHSAAGESGAAVEKSTETVSGDEIESREASKKRPEGPAKYVFVIDEINRGDISRILGELFFAIDPSYRGPSGAVRTQYANLHDDPNELFYVPENVYIIGTMNDIDRSVDSFDFAMRRRFHFVPVTAEDSIKMRDDLKDAPSYAPAIGLMNVINNVIGSKEPLQEPYKLGISYFADLAKTDPEDFDDAKDELWQNRIEPLLAEYIRGTDVQLVDFKNAWDGNTNSSAVGTESSAMADDENMNDDSDGEAND